MGCNNTTMKDMDVRVRGETIMLSPTDLKTVASGSHDG